MTVSIEDLGWQGEEIPQHQRYFSGGIHDNFVANVSDKGSRSIHHYGPNSVQIYPSLGNISRVSSYQDVLGDGKYLEFSEGGFVTFQGQNKKIYFFYKNKEAYENSKNDDLSKKPKQDSQPNWFKNLGLEELF